MKRRVWVLDRMHFISKSTEESARNERGWLFSRAYTLPVVDMGFKHVSVLLKYFIATIPIYFTVNLNLLFY